ncbi:MAG: hypothetical protein GYA16_09655 [Spirochaetes bacterium]|nr:hypothetical protein [Spirochaetota bacterium]
MRILIYCAILLIGFTSCQPSKPLTPQEAFNALKDAYTHNNMQNVAALLSTNSKKRIATVIHNLQSMNKAQLSAFAQYYGISSDSIKTMNIPEYLLLQKKIAATRGDDVLLTALSQPIAQVTIAQSKATVQLYNGMSLIFVKEGPYWYFEYE